MRILPLIISAAITVGLIIIFNTRLLLPLPLGSFLSPQHGIWQNAENINENFSADLKFIQLTGKVNVYVDDRLVPHVFAEQEDDVYFVQGYLHAKFRLWQMELQTYFAAGRASEIFGEKALPHDREFRRLGILSSAETALREMERDPATKSSCDAYTAGVNAYIQELTESKLPIEYKLVGYKPEKWSNLKTALFLKYMSYDLAAHENDFEMTNAKSYFNADDFSKLYPLADDSLDPVVPKGTIFSEPKLKVKPPATADSLYFNNKDMLVVQENKPDRNNGSNNWAVSGTRTQTGFPILCNDPHLSLNLPSLWFEMQLSTPTFNAYGATFPGAPGVIIGYNDSCAFGYTNGSRDVKDYYEIKFKDDSRKEYWFNGNWTKTEFRIEKIGIKDMPVYTDTVAYTIFGPVMFDKNFSGSKAKNINNKYYAVRWTAHNPGNELKFFNLMNHAKNYNDYLAAAVHLHTPGQNCAFASKNGDIAIRTQGEWPAKWKGQGDFIMPGQDSSYMWQGMIPQDETPYQYNPERGFISSANQDPADSSYPYYLGRGYHIYRGITINKKLTAMNAVSIDDMKALQTNNYNSFAAMAVPVILKNIRVSALTLEEKKYLDLLTGWDLNNDAKSKGATVFNVWWNNFTKMVFDDEFKKAPEVIMQPFAGALLDGVLRDSTFKFLDNIETPENESLADNVTATFKKTAAELADVERKGRLEWAKYKATAINHLIKQAPFSRTFVPVGGGKNCINATTGTNGPSWRMIVSLTPQTEAYGIYPGGQSGNPGSKFYDNFVSKWAAGEYYILWMMVKGEENDKRIKWKMNFSKS